MCVVWIYCKCVYRYVLWACVCAKCVVWMCSVCVSVFGTFLYLSVCVDECVDICVDVDVWCVCEVWMYV